MFAAIVLAAMGQFYVPVAPAPAMATVEIDVPQVSVMRYQYQVSVAPAAPAYYEMREVYPLYAPAYMAPAYGHYRMKTRTTIRGRGWGF